MSKRTVLVTGATGFTGGYVVKELLRFPEMFDVVCFVRSVAKAGARGLYAEAVRVAAGSFEAPESLAKALRGVDLLVNVASLGFGHAPAIIEACRLSGLRRALFVSTTSIYTKLEPASKPMRLRAEESIRESGLAYTILRPTMIFGDPGDRNIWRLVRWLDRVPALAVPGGGSCLVQPVYVVDLARAIVAAIRTDATIGRDYDVAGRDAVSFRELVEMAARLLGKRVFLLPMPVNPVVSALGMLQRLGLRSPITAEQILRLNEDKAFPIDEAVRDFGYDPIPLEEALRREIAYLTKVGGRRT
jgi:uncharacterized protein YbjT (DUF2867 family)